MNWRDFLTVQTPVVHSIPGNCGDVDEYVRNFEVMNNLIQTGKRRGGGASDAGVAGDVEEC